MSVPYPGNVNQPNRKDPSWDEYHTFEQRVNHELPDMRHDWQSDERDDVGFGVSEPWGESPKVPGALPPPPTVASVRVAATKAVRIAVLLLGEKVDDKVIEEQARDLMSMSGQAMDRTLGRFADTQGLYAEDKSEDEKKAEDKPEDEKKAADEKDDDKKAEDKPEDEKKAAKKDDKKAEDKKDEPPPFIQKKIEESKKGSRDLAEKKAEGDEKDEKKSAKKDDEKDAAKKDDEKDAADKDDDKKAEDKDDDKKAEDKDDADEKKAEDKDEAEGKKAGVNELGIELGAADEEEEEMDEKTAAQLQSLFEDKNVTAAEELEQKPESSKKAGIRKLGGQPRVASADGAGASDISSIWQSAPDVSEVFK
jgi:hypothetical protein